MAPVEGDHAEAAGLGKGGGLRVLADGAPDDLIVHGVGVDGLAEGPGGLALHRPVDLVALAEGDPCCVAPVGHLHAGHRPVAADGFAELVQVGAARGVVQKDVVAVGQGDLAVHHGVADADRGGAAYGLALIVVDGLVDGMVAVVIVLQARGGREDAVFEQLARQHDGGEKMGIRTLVHGSPCLCSFLWFQNTIAGRLLQDGKKAGGAIAIPRRLWYDFTI